MSSSFETESPTRGALCLRYWQLGFDIFTGRPSPFLAGRICRLPETHEQKVKVAHLWADLLVHLVRGPSHDGRAA